MAKLCYYQRMQVFRSRFDKLHGTSLDELMKQARREYHAIQKKTPRRVPYVRSKYFAKSKIFLNTFWDHLNQKSPKERVVRLQFYSCAIDLLRNTAHEPQSYYTKSDTSIGMHRFYGQTKSGDYFCVQVKENKRNNRKDFMSVFPARRPK